MLGEADRAPQITKKPTSFACVVNRIVPVGGPDHVVRGEVARTHVRDGLHPERAEWSASGATVTPGKE
ncbi:hypothetical protein GCM10023196_050250 [Actinoallomurus vinaceus]|uniref:Uncharacterized protein n=1 Tax=Actinoallomurus vinaceus TaxID=1080074 RepID=A0ABP8UEQ4_9ACTN